VRTPAPLLDAATSAPPPSVVGEEVVQREGQERGADTVAADVEQVEGELAVRQGHDAHPVAGEVGAGMECSRDAQTALRHLRRGQQRLLHARGQAEVPFQRLLGLAEGVFRQPARGHVRLDPDEVRRAPRLVADRRDGEPVPERRPVPPVVEDLDDALAFRLDCLADVLRGSRVGARTLEEAAVPAGHLRHRVAGDPRETLVGVDQRAVRQPGIGNRDPLGSHIERTVLQRERRPEDLRKLVRRRDLELIVAAVGWPLVVTPALEHRRVSEAIPLHVVVLDLADPLDAHRLPREVLARAPPALPARHARRAVRAVAGPLAPRVLLQRVLPQRLEFGGQLLPPGHRERRGHADVVQPRLLVEQPEEQRADELTFPGLVPSEPGDDAVGCPRVLHLEHRPLCSEPESSDLPNVGKSTLFNAVTRTRKAEAANYPFCTIDPNVGIVTVPDARLEALQRSRRPTSSSRRPSSSWTSPAW
jgi:hypothetical protein